MGWHFQTGTHSLCCLNKAYLPGSRGLRILYSSWSLKTGGRENSCTVFSEVDQRAIKLLLLLFYGDTKLLRNTNNGYNINQSINQIIPHLVEHVWGCTYMCAHVSNINKRLEWNKPKCNQKCSFSALTIGWLVD